MMRSLVASGLVVLASSGRIAAAQAGSDSLFQFTDLVAIDGSPISLAQFKGNVTLVVNVASY